jgi:hypothetical protein
MKKEISDKDKRITILEALVASLKTKKKAKVKHPQEVIDSVRGTLLYFTISSYLTCLHYFSFV